MAILLLAGAGCAPRAKYRQAADAEASCLIREKAAGPNWNLQDVGVYPSSASRMFDPFAPDCEPMPPDDPFSHRLMHCIDGKRGFPHWHKYGDTNSTQNPAWLAQLGLDESGVLVVDEGTALRLARIHSTDYQTELEDLFLSALDVSTERFRFDTQFFGGYEAFYTAAGRNAIGSAGAPRSQLDIGTRNVSATRFFTTGAELVAGFANSFVWQFSGNNTQNSTTLLDFTFIQPLLRNAGRDRILERLTIAERTLLANVRQMEWFRKGFFLDVLTGRGQQSGPSRRGGVFGAGLTGFTGTGGGFFTGNGGGGFGGGGGGGLGGSTAGGFIGLLQNQQTLRNEEANIAALQSSLTQLEAFRPSGRIDYFQVEQVRQQLFDNTSRFLSNKQAYQNSLDGFKQSLGLPPQVPMRIEDDLLGQFNLIDPELTPLQDLLSELQREVGKTLVPLLDGPEEGQEQQWRDRVSTGIGELVELLEGAEQLRLEMLESGLPRALADVKDLESQIPERLERSRELEKLTSAQPLDSTEVNLSQYVDDSLFETEYLEQLPADIRQKLADVKKRLEEIGKTSVRMKAELATLSDNLTRVQNDQLDALSTQLRERLFQPFPALLTDLSTEFLQVSLEQARARTERVTLIPVDIQAPVALEVARENRLDWMNARASLVDAWRLIEFNADDLEGFLNVVVGGDVTNVGNNPFRFNQSGRLRLGVQFDAPFTRLQERNVYREALIDYQRARRSYYLFEDNIAASIRSVLRQVDLDRINFELRRRALRVAVEQVRLARLELLRPPQTDGDRLGPTTAQNLINALNSLRNAQDAFLNVWVDYEIQRKLLDLSMGTMTLDNTGRWMDPGAIGVEYGYPAVNAEILSASAYDPVNVAPLESIEGRMPAIEDVPAMPLGSDPEPVDPTPVLPKPPAVDGPVEGAGAALDVAPDVREPIDAIDDPVESGGKIQLRPAIQPNSPAAPPAPAVSPAPSAAPVSPASLEAPQSPPLPEPIQSHLEIGPIGPLGP